MDFAWTKPSYYGIILNWVSMSSKLYLNHFFLITIISKTWSKQQQLTWRISKVTAKQREYWKNLIHLEFNQSPSLYFKWPSLSSCTVWLVPCFCSFSLLCRFCLSFCCTFEGFCANGQQFDSNYVIFVSNSFASIGSKQLQYRRMLTGHSIQHFIHIFRYRKIANTHKQGMWDLMLKKVVTLCLHDKYVTLW